MPIKEEDEDLTKTKYSRMTLVGDWQAARRNAEEYTFYNLYLHNNHKHLVQKTRALFANMTREVTLSPVKLFLETGLVVQFLAPFVRSNVKYEEDKGLIIAVSGSHRRLWRSTHFEDDCVITASPSRLTIIRNCFKIEGSDANSPDGSIIYYDDKFYIRTLEPEDNPYYIEVTNSFPGGLTSRNGEPSLVLVSAKTCVGKWLIQPLDPTQASGRKFPVKIGDKFFLKHVNSNRFLAVETSRFLHTVFGLEAEVSATNDKDPTKKNHDRIWQLVTGPKLK